MAIVRVQAPTPIAVTDGTSISVTWGSTTTAGNLLLAVLQVRQDATVSTVPTGMTLLHEQILSASEKNWIYYEPNCSARSGAQTFTVSATTDMTLHLVEYSGLKTSLVLDQTASDSSASTTVKSGTTATTSQASELWFAGICNKNTPTQGSPTNGFTQVNRVHSANATAGFQLEGAIYEKIVSATGTAEVHATIADSRAYGGLIVTLKAPDSGVIDVTAGALTYTGTLLPFARTSLTISGAMTWAGQSGITLAQSTLVPVTAGAVTLTGQTVATTTTEFVPPPVSHVSRVGWPRDPRQRRFLYNRPPFVRPPNDPSRR